MLIRELFASDVTRPIAPVVYFHDQNPEQLKTEVDEYIITGGWREGTPNHQRVPSGIHEEYVRLLNGISNALEQPGGPSLPTVWISGFYGSGKSSFAKLLGLALDGVALPDQRSLISALLERDRSDRRDEFVNAWDRLRKQVEPIAVVFDVGGAARNDEHVHSAVVRQVQARLDYCDTDPVVADFELKLERDGEWDRFLKVAEETLGKPWDEVKHRSLAAEDFSEVMSVFEPTKYTDPTRWYSSRAGMKVSQEGPDAAAKAIRDMLAFRAPNNTLFVVVDEVSQYVLSSKPRIDRLRAFAASLGSTLRGKAWLLALGQQKLDEQADDSFLYWAKDRFPPELRVHLAATNIRDVVHQRLLRKKPEHQATLRKLFEDHRATLKLYAYGCENVTSEEFVEVYPMLPGHIDLLLRITTALRTRSKRAQGDAHAIRGLLQLLGELFRARKLADKEVGALVTLDEIYEVQHTALDSDVQDSMARILEQCATEPNCELMVRAAKAVALLELIQEDEPTDAKLVAKSLYDRIDRGSQVSDVTEALESLRSKNLLGYSEKNGYKIQSSVGEEWERERREIGVSRQVIGEMVKELLKTLIADPERPRLDGRGFPWTALFSDGKYHEDAVVVDAREDACVRVDFRFLPKDDRTESTWIKRSQETAMKQRLIWLAGDLEQIEFDARELGRSRGMVRKFDPRKESLNAARKMLLQQEKNRAEELEEKLKKTVADAWMSGPLYFGGHVVAPRDHGTAFSNAILRIAERYLPNLYPYHLAMQVAPSEMTQLLAPEVSGPSSKFMEGELGILQLDAGKHVFTCGGEVPIRVQEHIENEGGVSGASLLSYFGAPPYGYTPNVVKSCVIGLLRAQKVKIQPDGQAQITAVRDTGSADVFVKERDFKRATIFPAGEDDIGRTARARICAFFEKRLKEQRMERDNHVIADAVQQRFPKEAQRLRDVFTRLQRLPRGHQVPDRLLRLEKALEQCLAQCRQTEPTVQSVKRHLDALNDGIELLAILDAELTEDAITRVRAAADVRDHQLAQLVEVGAAGELEDAAQQIDQQLALDHPWRDIAGLTPAIDAIRERYVEERQRRLAQQEALADVARSRVKARDGYSTLTGEQSHQVLRPLSTVITETTPDAVAPALSALDAHFALALRAAEDEANERLDDLVAPLVERVDLELRGREVETEADVDRLVEEIRERLKAKLGDNKRLRLL